MDILSPAEPLSSPGENKWQEGAQVSEGVNLLIQRQPTSQETSLSLPLGRLLQTQQQGGLPGSTTAAFQISGSALE